MTEEEAKMKWCPFARVGERASGAAENRPDGSYNCIGSDCMAWRWILVPTESSLTHQLPLLKHSNTQGYCGLAGKL